MIKSKDELFILLISEDIAYKDNHHLGFFMKDLYTCKIMFSFKSYISFVLKKSVLEKWKLT